MQDPSNSPDVLLRETDSRGVVRLTLNRPQAFNALSEALLHALQQQIDALMHDDVARVVIVRGAGRAFCAGHDLKEMRAHPS
ncbi:MAG: enoyl-CoA hydratase/isomerase family protein, partial [Thiomonas sp.]